MFTHLVLTRLRPARNRPVLRDPAGFTLVELLVALVLSSIIAAAVFQLLVGQSSFARFQNAREEVQQNARAALEIISSELRGVPSLAITQAGQNSIRFYLPRAWGLLCNPLAAGNTTVWVRFPSGVFPSEFQTGSTNWGIAIDTVTTSNPLRKWHPVSNVSTTAGGNNCSAGLGVGLGAPAGSVEERGFTGPSFLPAGAATVPPGAEVFVFQEVAYSLGSSSVPGVWIRRASPVSSPQPMAGPVPSGTGLVLTYFNAAGAQFTPAVPDSLIARIRIEVSTVSTAQFRNRPQDNNAATEVYLRNQ